MNRIFLILSLFLIISCSSDNKLEKKGFSVSNSTDSENENHINEIRTDSLKFNTRPRNVLLTANAEHRLTPIYKVNYTKKKQISFTGSNDFHSNYSSISERKGNQWNNNFMPGFEAVYGYNFVNVSHYNNKTQTENTFFEKPVLIKTLYYPAYSKDTLNFEAIKRSHYMVSTYDDDTNNDGFINVKDLRRFYYFDINAQDKTILIPKNYSVMNSEYDAENDLMYVFAKLDENKNGQMDSGEKIHIFWIDLKNPKNTGREY